MYIRRIEVRNYLIHRNTALDLSPLSVFVGPQGGGKSALFDAMLNFLWCHAATYDRPSAPTRTRFGQRDIGLQAGWHELDTGF